MLHSVVPSPKIFESGLGVTFTSSHRTYVFPLTTCIMFLWIDVLLTQWSHDLGLVNHSNITHGAVFQESGLVIWARSIQTGQCPGRYISQLYHVNRYFKRLYILVNNNHQWISQIFCVHKILHKVFKRCQISISFCNKSIVGLVNTEVLA